MCALFEKADNSKLINWCCSGGAVVARAILMSPNYCANRPGCLYGIE